MLPSNSASACALLRLDAEGAVVSFGAEAIQLGLLPEAAAVPVPLDQLPEFLVAAAREARACGAATYASAVTWRRPGLPPVLVDLHFLLVPGASDQAPNSSWVVAVVVPPTSEEAGESAPTSDISPWLSARAHEIKNSLVAVKTLVEVLLEREPGLEIAGIVRQEVQRINSIVTQMLKSTADRSHLDWVEPKALVESILQKIRPQLNGRPIQLQVKLEAADEQVWGDGPQIEQAVLNLVINALEALDSGGELIIRTSIRDVLLPSDRPGPGQPQRAYVITVSDNGAGIAPENRERVFDDYFTTKPGGTGLGLPLTAKIMREHRGMIEVRSEAQRGTTFELFFPLGARWTH